VVGIKPTMNLVPASGMVPLFNKQDTPGPITRSVKDAAYLLDVLCMRDNSHPESSYLEACSSIDVRGLRIGVPTATFPKDDIVLNHFDEALQLLEKAGATIVRDINYAGTKEFERLTRFQKLYVIAGAFQQEIKSYLGSLKTNPNDIRDIDDIIRLTKQIPEEEYPARGMEDFDVVSGVDISGPEYQEALERNKYFAEEGGILGAIQEYKLDVIASPAMFDPTNSFAARAGFPVIVIPLGAYPEGTELKYYQNGPTQLVDVGPNVP
jgi:amidase